MTVKYFSVFLLIISFCASCVGVRTSFDYDRELDYNQFKSFYVIQNNSTWGELDSLYAHEQLAEAFKNDGMTESLNPDLFVQLMGQEYISVEQGSTANFGLGFGGANGGGFGSLALPLEKEKLNRVYRLGILKANGGELIYEAIIHLVGTPNQPEEMYQKALIKGFNKILKNFPPEKEEELIDFENKPQSESGAETAMIVLPVEQADT